MNVLIACEESQRVCAAFRKLGHNAFSCDIQEPSGGHPEWHILDDVLKVLNPKDRFGTVVKGITFDTMDGEFHTFPGEWDLIIAHPPCTYLSAAGACRMYPTRGNIDLERYAEAMKGKNFFMQFLNAECEHIAVENPRPLKCVMLPQETQQIQPYQFGEPYSKITYLWLKGLPPLSPTNILEKYEPWIESSTSKNAGTNYNYNSSRRKKERAKTFPGIAKAMAEQWGGKA